MKLLLFLWLGFPALWAQDAQLPIDDEAEDEVDPVSESIWQAHQNFDKAKKEIQGNFRKELSKAVAMGSTVEIFLLDFEMVSDLPEDGVLLSSHVEEDEELEGEGPEPEIESSEYFVIKPYGTLAKVLKRKVLDQKPMEVCLSGVVKLLNEPDNDSSAWCHYPIHGIQITSKDGQVIFETSICYACGNYFLTYPDDIRESNWIDFGSEELEDFLKKEMPIPKAEIERFKKKFGR